MNNKDQIDITINLELSEQGKRLLDALRPKGEWVEVVHRTEQYDREGVKSWARIYQCPNCGFILNAIENHMTQYRYCPSCGADMRGNYER